MVRVARALPPGEHGFLRPARRPHRPGPGRARSPSGCGRDVGLPDVVVSNAGGFLLRPSSRRPWPSSTPRSPINLRAAVRRGAGLPPPCAGRGTADASITVGSVADHVGFPENAAYAASKYGLRGLHETLAGRVPRHRRAAHAGLARADRHRPSGSRSIPDQRAGFPRRAEMLRPADVADAVLFVATRPPHVLVDWLRLGPI